MRRWAVLRSIAGATMLLAALTAAGQGAVPELDLLMYQDPPATPPEISWYFSPKLKPAWLEVLAGPEADLRRQAAQIIAKAHRQGMPGLSDTASALTERLDAPDEHPVVVLAVVQALVALDARQTAPRLFKLAMEDGIDVALVVEPALASWDYRPIREVWLRRLSAPDASRRRMILAIRGLGKVNEEASVPRLRELAGSRREAAPLRLEAARALGKLRSDGLVADAVKLGKRGRAPSSPTIVDRLVAVSLLANHRDKETESLLLDLALDDEPAVAAAAVRRLLQIDVDLVIPIVPQLIQNDDANVRHLGVESLSARPGLEAISLLGPMLDDPHPDVRAYVRRTLLAMADDPELAQAVLDQALSMFATSRWRGLEQAALILVAMDHKPAAGRMVELLDFERPEVFVTAAWALRRLAVPGTLAPMLQKAQRESDRIGSSGDPRGEVTRQLCHLFEAFAVMKHGPADPLMRRFIPKNAPFDAEVRAAAVWSLGHVHAGRPDPELTKLLVGRLNDFGTMEPEDNRVRRMSAASLGRMQAKIALPRLRFFGQEEPSVHEVTCACLWAIHAITGEEVVLPTVEIIHQLRSFVLPID